MTRRGSVALGLATAVPLIAALTVVVFVLVHDRPWSDLSGEVLAVAVLLWLGAGVLGLLLTVAYVVLAVRNRSLQPPAKALWIVLLLLTGPLAGAVYWRRHVAPR